MAINSIIGGAGQKVVHATRTVLGSGSPQKGAFWATGATIGAVGGAATMGPSLFPHDDPKFQAAAIGIGAVAGFGVGSAVEGIARGAGRFGPSARMGTLGALAGAGLLTYGATKALADGQSNLQGIGTAGAIVAAASGASVAATALSRHLPRGGSIALPVVAGGGVLAMAMHDSKQTDDDILLPDAKLPKVDPESELATRPLATMTAEQAMPGVDPATVQLDKFPPNGLRFVLERPTAEEITATMGTPAKAEPLRLYVGLDEAPAELALPENEPQLVEWMTDRAMERMEASGAFERSHIMVAATTSTGFINPLAPMSNEMMTLGDVATVGMQAAHRKSMYEMDNLDRATAMHDMLLEKINAKVASMPADDRPTVNVYGESFGAWTSQDAFKGGGIDAIEGAGVEHAMYVGSPKDSTFRTEVLDDPRALHVRSAAATQEEAPPERVDPTATFLTHDADPVANFDFADLWRRPEWLGEERGEKISPHQKWWPGVTALQLGIDQWRAQFFTPGVLEAKGHDYRPEVGYVMRTAFDHDTVTDEQVARIREYGRQAEVRWTEAKDDLLPPAA